jgi:hypothetical protein
MPMRRWFLAWMPPRAAAFACLVCVLACADTDSAAGNTSVQDASGAPVVAGPTGAVDLSSQPATTPEDVDADTAAVPHSASREDKEVATLLLQGLKLLKSNDVEARYDIARELMRAEQGELALQHYVWLWPNSRRHAGYGGVRLSFMLSDMAKLAKRDEAAREAFAGIFEEVRAEVAEGDEPPLWAWMEFTSWCDYLGSEEDLLAWLEAHCRADGSVGPAYVADTYLELFAGRGDWESASRLGDFHAWAIQKVGETDMMSASLGLNSALGIGGDELDEAAAELAAFQQERLRTDLSRLCAAAWAAGRDEDGQRIAAALLGRVDDAETRLELVRVTRAAVGERPEHQRWLAEAAASRGAAR